ncbi:MAG: hypothetical protein ABH859_02865 [Pseudomonadota bacterium]
MVDPLGPGRVRQSEIKSDVARSELEQALRQSDNIHEVLRNLPDGITLKDFEEYLGSQWSAWKSQILQEQEVYSQPGMPPAPNLDFFSSNTKANTIAQADLEGFFDTLAEGEQAPASIEDMAQATLDEWANFSDELWGNIMDNQIMMDTESRLKEIEGELKRIIAMVRSGQADPEYILLALAKVNVTKNGVLFAGLGRKLAYTNSRMNQVANDLSIADTTSTDYFGQVQLAQSETRDLSMQQQQLTMTLQKVMQDVSGTLEQVHGMIEGINRTRREIIQKFTAAG